VAVKKPKYFDTRCGGKGLRDVTSGDFPAHRGETVCKKRWHCGKDLVRVHGKSSIWALPACKGDSISRVGGGKKLTDGEEGGNIRTTSNPQRPATRGQRVGMLQTVRSYGLSGRKGSPSAKGRKHCIRRFVIRKKRGTLEGKRNRQNAKASVCLFTNSAEE